MNGRGKGGVVSIIRYQTPCVYTNVSQIKLRSDRHKSGVIDKMDHFFFYSISNLSAFRVFLVELETRFYLYKTWNKNGASKISNRLVFDKLV